MRTTLILTIAIASFAQLAMAFDESDVLTDESLTTEEEMLFVDEFFRAPSAGQDVSALRGRIPSAVGFIPQGDGDVAIFSGSNSGLFGRIDPYDGRPANGAWQRVMFGLRNPEIIIGTDIYTGGALGTLANPGTSFQIQVPVFEDWTELSGRNALHTTLSTGLDFTHAHGNDDFQLNEPLPGGIQAEIDDIKIYTVCTDLEFEIIIRPDRGRARYFNGGVGLDLGTIDVDLETTLFNPAKTQFFVPVGIGFAELENDFLVGGEIHGGAGVETGFGKVGVLVGGFLVQTGAASGSTSTSTGVTVALEVKWGGLPGDFNADGVVDAGDYTMWRQNLGEQTTNPAFGDGVVDQEDFNVWQSNYGATSP